MEIFDSVSFTRAAGVFTNTGTVVVGAGATAVFGAFYVFNQNGGELRVEGMFEMSAEFSTAGDSFISTAATSSAPSSSRGTHI